MLSTWRTQCEKSELHCHVVDQIEKSLLKWKYFKSAVFAIGNSVYHNDLLYSSVEEILSILVSLLNDSLAKMRIHSAGTQFH